MRHLVLPAVMCSILMALAPAACGADRFEPNDDAASAACIGVAPGPHLANLSVEAGDEDWYRVEVLRPDTVAFSIAFAHAAGNLDIEVRDGDDHWVGDSESLDDDESVTLAVSPGAYYLHVYGVGGAANSYALAIEPGPGGSTVIYVNDDVLTNDFYCTAAGNDANSGLTPGAPKRSVTNVLSSCDLGPGCVLAIDTGTYGGSAVTITSADEGAIYAGSPGGSNFNRSGTRFDLFDADYNIIYGLLFGGSSGIGIYARKDVNNSTDNIFRANVFTNSSTAIEIDDGADNLICDNVISTSASNGIYIERGTRETVRNNTVRDKTYGIRMSYSTATIDANNISFCSYGIYAYVGTPTITDNTVADCTTTAIWANAPCVITGNEAAHSAMGIYSESNSGVLWGNAVHDNATGIQARGTIGPSGWDGSPNDVYANSIAGIDAIYNSATIQFNRVRGNGYGIAADNSTVVHHNLIYRNTARGVSADDADNVVISNNTIYTASGNGVHVRNTSTNVTLQNNIIWSEDGYDVYVATDSQVGFASDYNNLYATGSGKVVWWQKPFGDIFDWQVESDFDRNSIGYTAPDPALDNPRFANLAADDYHLTAGSTSIDAGNPADLYGLEPLPNGGCINLGAYGNTPEAAASQPAWIKVDFPDYYTDWEAAAGHAIAWHTFNVAGDVDIDLYREGAGKVADIAVVAASDGAYGWTPQSSGIAGTLDRRYRIRVTSVAAPAVFGQSREAFSVPPDGDTFFVNDANLANDEYCTAAGNNRNTARSQNDPKAVLLPVLRSYSLGPGDTVCIDTGSYIHVRNVLLSGNPTLGDDEGATFTGPTGVGRVATIDRANPYANSTNIELNDGDYVTLRHLTLTGAEMGIWVHNGSTNFEAADLVVSNNAKDGMRVETDAEASRFARLTAFSNGRHGLHIATPIASLNDCVVHHNTQRGIYLEQTGATVVEANVVYANGTGIYVYNSAATDYTVIGGDISLDRGNRIYDNTSYGVEAYYKVRILGNSVSGSSAANAAGIYAYQGPEIANNVVFGNYDGIHAINCAITRNCVYHNSMRGILAKDGSTVAENRVYSNGRGIELTPYSGAQTITVRNNLVYGSSLHAIQASYNWTIACWLVNNTIYEPEANGICLRSGTTNAKLRNNIIWAGAGSCIVVDSDSQVGFASDYNDLHATGPATTVFWQGIARTTLEAWRNTAFTDANSIAQDALFVDAAGPDGHLGYFDADHDGRDDDFHLRSEHGSFHGGSLAPVLGADGLPEAVGGAWVSDGAGVLSPGIDRGDAADSFANEPAPNGGFINMGAFGNTAQASKSPVEYVLVMRPDGGESWPARQTFAIRWRSHDFLGTVDIELMRVGLPDPVYTFPAGEINDGQCDWTIPETIEPHDDYLIRISRLGSGGTVSDTSNLPFTITEPVNIYYVNDAVVEAGDWTTAPGDDGLNNGLTPATPKASIRAVLQAYTLGTGDIIKVDSGTYTLGANIIVTSEDAGVTIEGYHDPAHPERRAYVSRGNTSSGAYAFELQNADGVTISHLAIANAYCCVYASNTSDSDGVTVSDCELWATQYRTIQLDTGNDFAVISGNMLHDPTGSYVDGIYTRGNDITILENSLEEHYTGIDATGLRVAITGNVVHHNRTGISVSCYTSVPADKMQVTGNTAYSNTSYGIYATYDVVIDGNTAYGHPANGCYGIYAYQRPEVTNNVVYGNYNGIYDRYGSARGNRVFNNSNRGIWVEYASAVGNRVYSNGTGIVASVDSSGASAGEHRNNIIYANTTAGFLLNSACSSCLLANNTIYEPAADCVRAATYARNLTLRSNILYAATGYAINVADNSQTGFSSDYNLFHIVAAGRLGYWESRDWTSKVDWFYELDFDQHSLQTDPLLADPDGPDGVLGYSGGVDGGLDDDFRLLAGSPGIDMGDPTAAFANEPLPNGGRVNCGCHGNTPDATTSPAELVQVLAPFGLEKLEAGQSFNILWRTAGVAGGVSVDIDLMVAGDPDPVLSLADDTANDGQFEWTVPDSPGNSYLVRVKANGGAEPYATSLEPFVIAGDGTDYYVNDSATANDEWSAAAGNNANSGKSLDQPVLSVRTLIAAYDLDPGDVIHIDTGTYNLPRNVVVTGADAGVAFRGPESHVALLNRGNTSDGCRGFELQDADGISIERLSIANAYDGIYAGSTSDSDSVSVTACDLYGHYSNSILFDTGNDSPAITGCTVHDPIYSYCYGIRIKGGVASILSNEVWGNHYGISVSGMRADIAYNNTHHNNYGIGTDYSTSVPADRIVVRENISHHNTYSGIYANYSALVTHNEVYAQTTNYGIQAYSGPTLLENVVYGNSTGIYAYNAIVTGNRVYNNSNRGVYADRNCLVSANTVYSNSVGVWFTSSSGGIVGQCTNNLIYANTNFGIVATQNTTDGRIVNNTIYQPVGDAIRLQDGADGFTIRNNILCVDAGYCMNAADDSHFRHVSDFNVLWASGSGKLGRWQGRDFTDRADWYYELGLDYHSIQAEPVFADPDGPDNLLGYTAGADHGLDDDFSLLPASPAIDHGDPASSFDLEPEPNGWRINAGHQGNTPDAATSPAESVRVIEPCGLEKFEVGTTMTITWQTSGLPEGTTVDVELISGAVVLAVLADDAADTGLLTCTVPDHVDRHVRARVTANGGGHPIGVSDAEFSIVRAGDQYFVNDDSLAGDMFCGAPGDNRNSGKDSKDPMASLPALLRTYDLGPGDTVYVDTGSYVAWRGVEIAAADAGVRIQGPGPAAVALINRANRTSYYAAIDLRNADDVTIDGLAIANAYYGVLAGTGSDSDRVTISHCDIYGHQQNAVSFASGNDFALFSANTVHDSTSNGHGIYVVAADAGIYGNTTYNCNYGIYAYGQPRMVVSGNTTRNNTVGISASYSTSVQSDRTVVTGNIVRDNSISGINASYSVIITGNTVYGQSGTDDYGIYGSSGTDITLNEVYGNYNGIYSYNGSIVSNRVFSNSMRGIYTNASVTVSGNRVFSNSIGVVMQSYTYSAAPRCENNLVYGNTNQGMLVTGDFGSCSIANNTVYQGVGDAIRMQSGCADVALRNNILWVEAGYDLYAAADSQAGFSSDRNILHQGVDPNAHVGFWGGAARDSLLDWRGATGQDANSSADDPLFVDADGADNVLGYTIAGGGYDGGHDDNFMISAGSPAIDHADTWAAPRTDIDGSPRIDDDGTPNTGGPDFAETDLGASLFAAGGTAKGWRSSSGSWTLSPLPFAFPFYGSSYTSVYVSSCGLLQFGSSSGITDPNSLAAFVAKPRIAALWDEIKTNGTGDDIFVESAADHVTIRWNASLTAGGGDVNMAVVLFSDGRVRFDYGPGNTGLTHTAGISSGNGNAYIIASCDGAATLTDANSLEFGFVNGWADIGCYEFRGSSLDEDPPLVVAIDPAIIGAGGDTNRPFDQIIITFSESLDATDARAPANYELLHAGGDNDFETGDDVDYAVIPHYTPGELNVTLEILAGDLPLGSYRLSILGDSTIHDLAGLALDGDDDDEPGGNYVRLFRIVPVRLDVTSAALLPHHVIFNGVEITGTKPGTTIYAADCSADESVTLTAPSKAYAGAATLQFKRWSTLVGGIPVPHPDGLRTELFVVGDDTSIMAEYGQFPGDANLSCGVNILDLIFIRNRLNHDVSTDDNWQADVNGDGRINILDLIFARNRLNSGCP